MNIVGNLNILKLESSENQSFSNMQEKKTIKKNRKCKRLKYSTFENCK
jgi:hypothetical protein